MIGSQAGSEHLRLAGSLVMATAVVGGAATWSFVLCALVRMGGGEIRHPDVAHVATQGADRRVDALFRRTTRSWRLAIHGVRSLSIPNYETRRENRPFRPVKGTVFSIRARANSFVYAFRGVRALLWREHNAWLHLLAAALRGRRRRWWFRDLAASNGASWRLRSARCSRRRLSTRRSKPWQTPSTRSEHPLVGHAKDLAAAGVLLASRGRGGGGTA